ncbi:MAG: response regulator [Synergistaceae bacterium]|nr:response regulator [Synergistaceae bacterium]
MPKRVFILDDADFIVDMLCAILKDAGHRIVGTAGNGPDALEAIAKLPADSMPEIVTVDFYMPRMDGLETINRIRALLPDVRILLISAHATLPVAMKARETGVDAFIVKPFEPRTLLETLDRLG